VNVSLWVLQILLALHTAMGAVWKLSNPAAGIPSLRALPQGAWLGLAALEVVAAVVLLAPPLARFAPYAAGFVAAEMLLFTALHFASGVTPHGEVAYWLVVAALSVALAAGRVARGGLGVA
jgi:hypothetical protein